MSRRSACALALFVLLLSTFLPLSLRAQTAGNGTGTGNGYALVPAALEQKLADGRLAAHFAWRKAEAAARTVHGAARAEAPAMRVVVYRALPPTEEQVRALEAIGVQCLTATWTPPMDNHPLGFFLAVAPLDRIPALLAMDCVARLGSAEGANLPLNNTAARAIRAPAAWSRGWTGAGVKVGILDSGIDTSYAGNEFPADMVAKNYVRYPAIDDDVYNRITGHGTHVAGTVLGRGTLSAPNTANEGGPYQGIAPGADLAFMRIGNDTTASAEDAVIIAALHDLVTVHHARVVNLSYGGWGAYHDGSEALEQKADWCYTQGMAVVFAAGNSARDGRHYTGSAPAGGESDFIEVRASNIKDGESRLSFNLVWFDSLGTHRNLTLRYYDADKHEITDSVNRAPTTESPRGTESQYSSLQSFLPAGSSVRYLKVANPSSAPQIFHVYEDWFEWSWWAQGSITFAAASQNYTVCSPSIADHALSVAAYVSRSFYTSALGSMRQFSQSLGKIASFSGVGPRVDGAQKPDIAAPGSMLVSVRDTNVYRGMDQSWIDDDGRPGGEAHYVVMQGTSMATPVVTGAVAVLLSAHPELTPQQVYDSLTRHALRDTYTGSVPNNRWGAGKLDLGFLAGLPSTVSGGWVKVSAPGWDTLSAAGVAQDAQGVVYATIGKPMSGGMGTLYRSADAGATWSAVKAAPGLASVLARPNGTVYAAQRFGGKLFRSTTGGGSWDELGPDRDYTAIALAAGDSLLAAATWGQGVFTSSDDGATWDPVSTGLPAAMTVPVLAAGRNGWLFACANDNNTVHLFRANKRDFLWARADSGMDTTKHVNACAVTPDGTAYAVVWDRVYRSVDDGASWQQMAILNDYLQSVHAVSNSTVLVGTVGAGVYRSTDYGTTWRPFSDGLTTLNIAGFCSGGAGNAFALGSPGSVFRRALGALPAAPSLLAPADNAADLREPVALRWTAPSGASSYTLEILARQDLSAIPLRVDDLPDAQWSLAGLGALAPCWWRVRANNNAGAGPWSVSWKFTTAPAPPPAPQLVSPVDGSVNIALPVPLAWTAVIGASSYRLQVATDSAFTILAYQDGGISGISRQVSGLAGNTLHYWRAAAENGGGSSPWTAAWTFRTEKQIYPIPSRRYPPDDARMVPVALTMRWDSTAGASAYHVQLARDTSFASCIVDDSTIVAVSRAAAGLAHFAGHAWRIRALYAGGASAWSPAWSFTTTLAPAALLAPLDSATDVPLAPAFLWSPVQGATSYRLELAADAAFAPPVLDTAGIPSTAYGGRALSPSTRYYWRVRGANADGEGELSPVFTFVTTPNTAAEPAGGAGDFVLEQNTPNPASGMTEIGFRCARGGYATLRVFDLLGRCVATVASGDYAPGGHAARLDVSPLPPGAYLLALTMDGRSATRMMAVRR